MSFDATTIAAWWGAGIGTAVLLWDVIKWVYTRPQLVVHSNAGQTLVSSIHGKQPGSYVLVSVSNRGRTATTVTGLAACCYQGRWARFRKRSDHGFVLVVDSDQPLPCKLEPGEQWRGFFPENEEIVEFGKRGIVDLFLSVSHRDKPIRKPIVFGVFE